MLSLITQTEMKAREKTRRVVQPVAVQHKGSAPAGQAVVERDWAHWM